MRYWATILVPSKSKWKAHLGQPGLAHGMAQAHLVLGVEHQEAAAARPDQLAADRAVVHSEIVPVVDLRIGHAARALALVLPVLVHQPAEADEVARLERRLAAQAEVLHVMKIVDHGGVVGLWCADPGP